ncbi:MAG: glycosyltransferase family 4 protein [Candidatus Fimivivens sp.]|nr:glycosyltransferase family 4 protein [Candidatus Fimivivens sp.]
MMRVLLINPWAVNNDGYYTSGFVSGMNKWVCLDFVTNYYYIGEAPNGMLINRFFKISENMKRSIARKAIRGIEYITTWVKLLHLAKRQRYDVIHIHWLLMYGVDSFFLKRLKKNCNNMVLTAHNVLPHINGQASIQKLRNVYCNFDHILVHGESIKEEFGHVFPNELNKVAVQYHGEYYKQNTVFEYKQTPDYEVVKKAIDSRRKIFITFGNQFYNKGTDRLAEIWLESFAEADSLLIIIGDIDEGFVELKSIIPKICNTENLILIDHYIDEALLNFYVSNSDCIVLPYRHASMSGVVFTAASFSKPVICTRSGALTEYLENGIDSFICENNIDALREKLFYIDSLNRNVLSAMGKKLSENVKYKYSWDTIARQLMEDIYSEEKRAEK